MALKNSEGTGSHFPFFPAVRCVSVSYVIPVTVIHLFSHHLRFPEASSRIAPFFRKQCLSGAFFHRLPAFLIVLS